MARPNYIRYGLGTAFIAVSTDGITIDSKEVDRDDYDFIRITNNNRRRIVEVLRCVANFIEATQ